ncbi:hypothetical protein [Nocardia brasiliensis]|uniref:hypothetical protein n=1 Tax=Nocardia brasiliensis TaxID=37326 RepID=UPI003D8F6BC7
MKSVEVWMRVLAGGGVYAGIGVVLLNGAIMLFAGMPDEDIPAGLRSRLAAKSVVVGVAAVALFIGAATARVAAIVVGCLLFLVDFALLLAWDAKLHNRPRHYFGGGELTSMEAILLTVWVVFPILTMVLAIVSSARCLRR